jgi:hypothetical protein
VLKIDVDERRLGLGIIGLVENPEEVGEHNEVLRDALTEAGIVSEKQPAAPPAEKGSEGAETDAPEAQAVK